MSPVPEDLAPGPATPAHQRRKAERPQELLDAALALFVEKGFAATKSEDVARRAGVSKGTLYLYYPSKEDLLKAVIEQRLSRQLVASAATAASYEGSATQLLQEVFSAYWTDLIESDASGVFKLIVTEVRNFPEIATYYQQEVVQRGQALVAQILARGIARGEFRPVDIGAAVQSLVLPMVMLCVHKHSVGACSGADSASPDPRDFIHAHIGLVLHGLRSETSAATPATATLAHAATPTS